MDFDNHDSRIKYYESLPEGYRFVFYRDGRRIVRTLTEHPALTGLEPADISEILA